MADLNLAVIYYSSTGTNHQMAQWAEEAGNDAGANVRLRKIPETAPMEAIESNPAWKENYDKTQNIEEAAVEDLNGQMQSCSACPPALVWRRHNSVLS